MRPLARQIIQAATVAAGLPEASLVDKPKRANKVIDIYPRAEFDVVDESLSPGGGLCRVAKADEAHLTKRYRAYERRLKVRLAVVSKDETWLEAFVDSFLAQLPKWADDAQGNPVKITATRATRGGFETLMLEVFPAREAALYLDFQGGLYREETEPLIRSVNLVDGLSVQ
jgi:hypothetical protein